MKTVPKKPNNPSTQSFIEIEEIKENFIILKGGYAAIVIEVQSTNFALLSEEEQRVKLLSYASLLNSLSFPIQVLVRSKRIDITSYINSLTEQASHVSFAGIGNEQKEKISSFILKYKGFIEDLTKVNTVLDKKFYIIISYSSLEQGAKGAVSKEDIFEQSKASLKIKADSLLLQIQRLSLRAKILEQKDLVTLFYELFNSQAPKSDVSQGFGTLIQGKI